METPVGHFVHIAINAVDTVALDLDGRYDPEIFDHYPSFTQARDAALSCVELLLDQEDYDGEDHRDELERMRVLLEGAETFEDLDREPAYQWFAGGREPVPSAA